ncbi:unnamed protein product [Trichobilharzia szidati]|nr:unnamed protein product [Trichobilharzia szidati]
MPHNKPKSASLTNQVNKQSSSVEQKRVERLHELSISLIRSVVLPPCEVFTESNAIAFIKKYYKNKPIKYNAFVLPDKIILAGKNSKSNVYPKPCIVYSEVKHIFTTSNIPKSGCFVLCIDSRSEKQSRYEMYQIKDAESHNLFLDLLNCYIKEQSRIRHQYFSDKYNQRGTDIRKVKITNSRKASTYSQEDRESLFNFATSVSNLSNSQLYSKAL